MFTKVAASILFSVVMSSATLAQDTSATVGDLEKVQSQTELLKAQVAKATAAADLRAKDPQSTAGGISTGLPGVKAVFGRGRRLFATFVFAGGATMDAKAGDTLSPGMSVRSVAIDRVVVRWHGTDFPLGFSTLPPVTGHANLSPSQGMQYPGMPGMPGMPGGPVGAGN